MKESIESRLYSIRRWMVGLSEPLDALVVPTMDPHNSEYVAEHWQMRRWLTGFTGSAGLAIVTPAHALLWTDSRYWLQAEEQLAGTPFVLMREGEDVSPHQWIADNVTGRVGFPEDMMVPMLYDELFAGCDVCPVPANALDFLWTDRPSLPFSEAEIVPVDIAGEEASMRLSRVVEWLKERKRDSLFVSDLAEVCWMLNLRACDIPYNPFLISFLQVNCHRPHVLYVHSEQITESVKEFLSEMNVMLAPYAEGMALRLKMLGEVEPENPIAMMKTLKNPTEQEGFRAAHIRDGLAMVRFLRKLDEEQGDGWTELSAEAELTRLRAQQPGFKGLSFETISAFGPHAAIVHYEPSAETNVPLKREDGGGLFLLDSGAHYDCGTTDITRTVALGTLTEEEKKAYTLVLKGHLQLQNMIFPDGTTGLQLDTAARMSMWRMGYDYGHGTGHGVGFRLGVHEGPLQIRKNYRLCTVLPFRPVQVITDEPGIYVAGKFGIRIENMLLCVPKADTDFGSFLCFEPLTMCPYDLRPIVTHMLTDEELGWLNDYHQEVRRKLLPYLTDEPDREWLLHATIPLER